MSSHFQIPLNLPHAATVAERLYRQLQEKRMLLSLEDTVAETLTLELMRLLWTYKVEGENPVGEEAERVKLEAAEITRRIVEGIEKDALQSDRAGQCIRNIFECLEMGKEGAQISLRAGENPQSAQRPA